MLSNQIHRMVEGVQLLSVSKGYDEEDAEALFREIREFTESENIISIDSLRHAIDWESAEATTMTAIQ